MSSNFIRNVLYSFLIVYVLTAGVTLFGLCHLWTSENKEDLPYLNILLTKVILETVGVIIIYAKKGLGYMPKTIRNKSSKQNHDFLKKFLEDASSIIIVSSRGSWIGADQGILDALKKKADEDTYVEIITNSPLSESVRDNLVGVKFIVTNEESPPKARFTLINNNRPGGEQLAIAVGSYPSRQVTIFDNQSGPQFLAMASDIIESKRKLISSPAPIEKASDVS